MRFNYKGFEVKVWKNYMLNFVWYAQNVKTGDRLGDREGGDLVNMVYAKRVIKKWINKFLANPYRLKRDLPEIIEHISKRTADKYWFFKKKYEEGTL